MEVVARYSHGGGGSNSSAAAVAWKMGRIMLKYRPIAPKPAAVGGAVPAAGPVDNKPKSSSSSSRSRRKRKGSSSSSSSCMIKAAGGRRGRRTSANKSLVVVDEGAYWEQERKACSSNRSASRTVVTLPLMPVTPERREEESVSGGHVDVAAGSTARHEIIGSLLDTPRQPRPALAMVSSCVTVECVTDTWKCGQVIPCCPTGLGGDACPCFLSDERHRVTWTNAAYRRMVAGPTDDGAAVWVELVTRGLVPENGGVTCFTCRVRVQYACRRRGKVSMAAPCDVWRLADGRLAWRLDVKAALSLSIGS